MLRKFSHNIFFPLSLIILGLVLRTPLPLSRPFFGDQAWFYISARDSLLNGPIPTLGITTSATWLNQGPLFTYMLIPLLILSNFDPVTLATLFSLLLTSLLFLILFFQRNNYTLWLVSISPFFIFHDRSTYHTSFIPLFVLILLISLQHKRYFLSGLILGFIYQLEIASVILWPSFLIATIRSGKWGRIIFGFLMGILPFILFAPEQPIQFFKWVLMEAKVVGGFRSLDLSSLSHLVSRVIAPNLPVVSAAIFILALIHAVVRKYHWFILPFIAFWIRGQASESYFILLVIPLTLCIGNFLNRLPRVVSFFLLIIFTVNNIQYLFRVHFLDPIYANNSLQTKLKISRELVSLSATSVPTIYVTGNGSEFKTSVDPYNYLAWWLFRRDAPGGRHFKFVIDEKYSILSVLE